MATKNDYICVTMTTNLEEKTEIERIEKIIESKLGSASRAALVKKSYLSYLKEMEIKLKGLEV